MKIINKLYKDWTLAIQQELRNLTLREEGDLCTGLDSKLCDTFVAFEGNLIVGWGVYFLDKWLTDNDFMLYVRESYRCEGIGRELTKVAIDKYGTASIHIWDSNSGKFFSKILKEMSFLHIARGSDWLEYVKEVSQDSTSSMVPRWHQR